MQPWLPEFLKNSRPARAGLEVLVTLQEAARLDNPQTPHRAAIYLEHWKDKVRELLTRTLKEAKYGHQEVRGILLALGPQVADQYQAGDDQEDDLLEALRLHPEAGGLEELLAYLRDPSPANKKDLLHHYPQGQPVEPKEPEISLGEFLRSL
jgi:hypothetical protein